MLSRKLEAVALACLLSYIELTIIRRSVPPATVHRKVASRRRLSMWRLCRIYRCRYATFRLTASHHPAYRPPSSDKEGLHCGGLWPHLIKCAKRFR